MLTVMLKRKTDHAMVDHVLSRIRCFTIENIDAICFAVQVRVNTVIEFLVGCGESF